MVSSNLSSLRLTGDTPLLLKRVTEKVSHTRPCLGAYRRKSRKLDIFGSSAAAAISSGELCVTTFNILAPIYKRFTDGTLESECADKTYIGRNEEIARMLCDLQSDVFCLQEFWCQNEEVSDIYSRELLPLGYDLHVTPRTNQKGDGLATLVRQHAYDTISVLPIKFKDCANRVAQLVHLAAKSNAEKEVIVVNTHLVFPYNSNSILIQLRETMKILEFLNEYIEQRGKLIPIIICGDFNSTRYGAVGQFLESQGFVSAYDAHTCEENDEPCWVSHMHRDGSCVGVDFQWVLNPSVQRVLPPAADWKAAIFAMIMTVVYEDCGIQSTKFGFKFFSNQSTDKTECTLPIRLDAQITREAFGKAVDELGLTGEGSIGLLENEIDECYKSMDTDGNMTIDYEEFMGKLDIDSFGAAYEKIKIAKDIDELDEWQYDRLVKVSAKAARTSVTWTNWQRYAASSLRSEVLGKTVSLLSEDGSAASSTVVAEKNSFELKVVNATLPNGMDTGEWNEEFDLSDHAPLQCFFDFA